MFQILKALLKIWEEDKIKCPQCGSEESELEETLKHDAEWYNKNVGHGYKNKSPTRTLKISFNQQIPPKERVLLLYKLSQRGQFVSKNEFKVKIKDID